MRIVVSIAILLVICGVVVSLYIRHDTKRLVEDIRNRRVITTNNQELTDSTKDTSQVEYKQPEETQQVSEMDVHVSEPVKNDGTQNVESSSSTHQFSNFDLSSTTVYDQDYTAESEQQEKTFNDLSLEQIIENNRNRLIEKYGDIPEVHTYLKYFPFESLLEKNSGKEYSISLSLEAHLKYQKAIAHLFPSKANRDNYLQALEMYENFKDDDYRYHESK